MDKKISSVEVITYVLFTLFLIITVLLQLNTSDTFKSNQALSNWISNSTFQNDYKGLVTIDKVKDSQDYYMWLDSLLVHGMYKFDYTDEVKVPQYRRNHIATDNLLISPVRLTQRLVKLVDNTDKWTSKLMPKRWISPHIEMDAFTEYNENLEFNGKLQNSTLSYSEEGSFYNLGGYV